MEFIKIDTESWARKDSYNHYFNDIPCTYSITVELDITRYLEHIKAHEQKFFPCILFAISHTVNKHKEFRMDFDEDKNIGYYSYSNPCYTVFHPETETITNIWTEYNCNFDIFLENYNIDMSQYQHDYQNSKQLKGKNTFNVSCIPWTSFKAFNLNLAKGYDYLLPIFTIGKYFVSDDKTLLPLAIQVHHCVCDGFHLSRFVNDLQNFISSFPETTNF